MDKPYRNEYSLGASQAYVLLQSYERILSDHAQALVALASVFGEVRLPFEGTVLAVSYDGGYYAVTFG